MERTLVWTLATATALCTGPLSIHAQQMPLDGLTVAYASMRSEGTRIPVLQRLVPVEFDDAPLGVALARIAEMAQLRLTYSADLLEDEQRVTLAPGWMTAGDALLRVLRGTGLDVMVSPGGDATVVRPAAREAQVVQQTTVAGRVTDSTTGAPLAGAAVTLVGTERRALTGEGGTYSFAGIAAGRHEVRAQHVGYQPGTTVVQVGAGQSVTADLALSPQAVALEGIVAIGYGTQARRDVTGAIASVKAEEIKDIPTPNAMDAVKGRIPGVDVVSTGYDPGEGMRVRIRGTRSIQADNEPLYVIDGIPLSGGIEDINPGDIQSIEVLKDASATAIYGARGANGVVLITTQQGRRNGVGITYDTYAGVQDPINRIELFSGAEFAEYRRESRRGANRYLCPGRTVCEAGDRALFFGEELEGIAAGRSTDWQDLILRQGLQQSHQLAVSGGDENTRFAVNVNYFDQSGTVRGQGFDRKSGGFSFDRTFGKLHFGLSSLLSRSDQELGRGDGLVQEAILQNPLAAPYTADGKINFLPTPDALRSNPLSDIENWVTENIRTRVVGSLFAEYAFTDGLSYRMTFGPDLSRVRRGEFQGAQTNARRGAPAAASRADDETFAYTLSNVLNYERDLGADHGLDATLLYEIQQQRQERATTAVSNLPYEHQLFHNLSSGAVIEGVDSDLQEWSLQSYMARLNYSFLDRYLLTVTGRLDGSSRLAEGNKYSLFPSVALGWRVTDEPFMRNQGLFSDLKLRASFGITGNTSISPYQTQGSLARTAYAFRETPAFGYRPSELANADLVWEKTEQLDIGLDFGLLDNRVTGTLDYYRANTRDLLLDRQLPGHIGYTGIIENIGQTRNTGFELGLSTLNLEDWHGVRWTTDVSFSTNRNEIVSLFGGVEDDVGNGWFIGHPIDVYYDYEFDGIWQLDQAADAAKFNQKPGQIRVVDQNGDSRISAEDRVIIAPSDRFPKWIAGLSTRLDWSGFDLAMNATTRQGVTLASEFHRAYNKLGGRTNNIRVDYWTPERPSNEEPQPDNNFQGGALYDTSRMYRDGNVIRIRNVTLGYTVPGSIVERIGAGSLRIYGAVQEPIMFTNYIGFDPESGTDVGSPSYRTLLIGLSVGL